MVNGFELSKKFYESEWNDELFKVHNLCVIDCCKNAILNIDLNLEIFEIAGWIHDIGVKESQYINNKISINYLNKFFEIYPGYLKYEKELRDCILNHRSDDIPKTIYGRVFQIADKLSKKHKNWIEYIQNNSNINKTSLSNCCKE